MANMYTMEEVLELGAQVPEEDLDTVIDMQRPNQCCVLIYTSGTTGPPKGVMLSQDNITWMARYGIQSSSAFHSQAKREATVSYLPLSHITAQMYDLWTGMYWGMKICFAEPNALKGSIVDTLREVEPTIYLAVPRMWEKIMERIQEVMARLGFIRRRMLLWAMSVMLEQNLTCLGSDRKPVKARLVDYLVLAKVRQALGFARCQLCFCGAAPMTVEAERVFLGLNLRLYSGYGLSEASGSHFVSSPNNYRLYRMEVKLTNQDADGTGKICLWGRDIFMGYLNKEDKTREAIDADGWLHTGDIGRLDAHGFLYITGRLKVLLRLVPGVPAEARSRLSGAWPCLPELIITSGGENVAPKPIEDAVRKELPIVSCAMLIGDQRKFLSMLLTLKVGPPAPGGAVGGTGPGVAESRSPTMKLKRFTVLEKHKAVIDSFYQEHGK
ncbi:Long-chain-fatty-acid--CoA ligase ACSBG1 [Pteropus alecto]|uniref:Long-chain-fatty-acid--CoA ligase ACSBG1 n=1 Tax=Pteropus alecto TaxID=9402 RepID=L5L4K1_PTEAL|nr:Long-chain-fatty-acid--CoA ligase ACSBG1 [Pteropus alecto]